MEDRNYAALSVELDKQHTAWSEAMRRKEYLKASYLANDLEATIRKLTTITHYIYEESHGVYTEAPPLPDPSPPSPPKSGD